MQPGTSPATRRRQPCVAAADPEQPLRRNAATYDYLRDRLAELDWERQPEAALACVEQLADFAAVNHPGRFADGGVENVALAIGRRLDEFLRRQGPVPRCPGPRRRRGDGRRNVWHVATATTGIGGMTRTIVNWIKSDPESRHSLLLTRQEFRKNLRTWLPETVRGNGGDFITLPLEANLLVRARWVREILRSAADLVVLHLSWSDVVPVLALAAEGGPPVALVNQVDHIFWLGGSVTDAVINLRGVGQELSERRRFVGRNLVLPIPLREPADRPTREEARRALGIPAAQVVLLTVGRDVKYLPTSKQNCVATACKILDQNPAADLYIIGASAAEAAKALGGKNHDRVHFLGVIENPALYQAAADVYLESFPFGSQTALLEAGLAGVPPVRGCAPPFQLLTTNDESIDDISTNPGDEAAYIEQANALIRNPSERRDLGLAFQQRIREAHTGTGWRERLGSIYRRMEEVSHSPRPLPREECSRADEDVALAAWQESMKARASSPDHGAGAWPQVNALQDIIRQLRDRSQRSSRLSSAEVFRVVAGWIEELKMGPAGECQEALRRELLLSLTERLTWAKWARDWAGYWELRRFLESEWQGEGPLPAAAVEWIAPRLVYRVKDVLDQLFRRLSFRSGRKPGRAAGFIPAGTSPAARPTGACNRV